MKPDALSDKILSKYHMVMRLVSYALVASSAVYCIIVANLQAASTPGPFGISPQETSSFSSFLPLLGVGLMVIGVLLHRIVPLSQWFLTNEKLRRVQIVLILLLLRLMLLQMALIPAMFYFLLGHGSECILLIGLSGIFLMLIGIPKYQELIDVASL